MNIVYISTGIVLRLFGVIDYVELKFHIEHLGVLSIRVIGYAELKFDYVEL